MEHLIFMLLPFRQFFDRLDNAYCLGDKEYNKIKTKTEELL